MAKRTPRVFMNVFRYFIDSFKPRQVIGNPMGKDYLGNEYFEIPADPSRGKRRPERWFKRADGESGFDAEKPAEWESWLRHRRPDPPTEEEVLKNLAIIKMKQQNAAILEAKYAEERGGVVEIGDIKGKDSFPKYEEYSYGNKPPNSK